MTVTLDIPADLQGTLLARAAMNGSNMEETIVILLRDSVISPGSSQQPVMPLKRLEPSVYSDEIEADDSTYQPVPFSPVGAVIAHLIPAGRLMPATFPNAE
ncbi:MAG TPA: hypothetical protein VG122_13820 [Gemmata sp.]|nr:hypothetical protein [Gemmata sp.]